MKKLIKTFIVCLLIFTACIAVIVLASTKQEKGDTVSGNDVIPVTEESIENNADTTDSVTTDSNGYTYDATLPNCMFYSMPISEFTLDSFKYIANQTVLNLDDSFDYSASYSELCSKITDNTVVIITQEYDDHIAIRLYTRMNQVNPLHEVNIYEQS